MQQDPESGDESLAAGVRQFVGNLSLVLEVYLRGQSLHVPDRQHGVENNVVW